MIDTTFLRDVRKTVARRVQDPGRSAQFVGTVAGEEPLDRGAALRRAQVAARRLAAVGVDRQNVGRFVESGAQTCASRSFFISIRKRVFGQISRAPPGRSPDGPFSMA